MLFRVSIIAAAMFLQACGPTKFNPPIHELKATSIPDFPVKGAVSISNKQPDTNPVIIHSYVGVSLESDYKSVTDTFVSQAKAELLRHGQPTTSGQPKSIGLKVTYLNSRYIAFFWKGTMTFTVNLGNGESFSMTVKHGTGAGAQQDLSGSIADGVVALFKDPRVKQYLAS